MSELSTCSPTEGNIAVGMVEAAEKSQFHSAYYLYRQRSDNPNLPNLLEWPFILTADGPYRVIDLRFPDEHQEIVAHSLQRPTRAFG